MQRRTGTPMRFWLRRRRRLDSLTMLLIELDQLAGARRTASRRATLRF